MPHEMRFALLQVTEKPKGVVMVDDYPEYDHICDASMGETAENVVAFARKVCSPVYVTWGDCVFVILQNDDPEYVLTLLEMSADNQYAEELQNKEQSS